MKDEPLQYGRSKPIRVPCVIGRFRCSTKECYMTNIMALGPSRTKFRFLGIEIIWFG